MSKRVKHLDNIFKIAGSNRDAIYNLRKNWEEMYYSDVDGTKSQDDASQSDFIDKMYKIPLSTKIGYALIQQQLAFLTSNKPFPKLIATTDAETEFVQTYHEAYQGVWYESQSDQILSKALQDMLVVGSGFIRVRPNNFYEETTFNTRHEYVHWSKVYVDPYSQNENLQDAAYIIIAETMPKDKAEKKFDITLRDNDLLGQDHPLYADWIHREQMSEAEFEDKKHRHVWIREFYEKIETKVYISEEGYVSTKRPKLIEIDNPKKEKLKVVIEELQQRLRSLEADTNEQKIAEAGAESTSPFDPNAEQSVQMGEKLRQAQDAAAQSHAEITEKLREVTTIYGKLPARIDAFQIETETGEVKQTLDVVRDVQTRIKRTLMVGKRIVDSEFLPIAQYPIVHFTAHHRQSPNHTYGTSHFTQDLQKAMNKFWSMLIYDMLLNNNRRVLYPEGSITEPDKIQKDWSLPNAWIPWKPNPDLPNGGKPEIQPPSPLNQVLIHAVQDVKSQMEYVTGIHGVLQGQNDGAPGTYGATASLQSFGTQRIKLYARHIEPALEILALVTVGMLQAYAPKDKVIKYIDSNMDGKELQIMSSTEDLKFKTRINIISSLPSTRLQSAQLLANVAGQTQNPAVADALTKRMLQNMDLESSQELAQEIDVIKQLQGQIQQLQESNQTYEDRLKAHENNAYFAETKHKTDMAATKAETDIAIEKEKQLTDLSQNDTQEEVPF